MSHLSKDDLHQLLSNARERLINENVNPGSVLSLEEQELLKQYIPMQLGDESAKRMMTVVNEIREGKRPPLSEQDRINLNQENMNESLQNFLSKLSSASAEEMESIYDMCECIRASRSGH